MPAYADDLGIRQLQALERIIQETVQAVERSRYQIFAVAEATREEYDKVREELERVRREVAAQIALVDELDGQDRMARLELMKVSRDFRLYTEDDIKAAYEKAADVQARLHVAQEREKELRRRREDLERRVKSLEVAARRAEELVSQVGVVLGYLTGNLRDLTVQVSSWHEHFRLGLSLLKAQEDERRRLAREIHDGPAQVMAAAAMRADVCLHCLREDVDRATRELLDLKELVSAALFDVRRIIFDLRPMSLDELGLVPAIRSWLSGWQERTGVEVRMEVRGEERRLPEAAEIALFRVLQEALNNVWKHAGVDRAYVSLNIERTRVRLVVSDRGKGFDPSLLDRSTFGLVGMKERVQFLGGKCEIVSRVGRGTRVKVEIPLGGPSPGEVRP